MGKRKDVVDEELRGTVVFVSLLRFMILLE